MSRSPRHLTLALIVLVATLLAGSVVATPAPAAPVTPVSTAALPGPSAAIAAARSATDWWYANGGGATSDASWRWAPYFMGVEELYRATGDARYLQWLQSWGDRNGWSPTAPASPTSNPDARAAIQVWQSVPPLGVTANLAPSDAAMAADLALPRKQYWWIDALFMGLPLWTTWTDRTGDPRYRAKGAEFYQFLRTDGVGDYRTGCPGTGLFDTSQDLWWRDCSYVTQRDAQGQKVFWARGNGWVMGALARTLATLPVDDPQHAVYAAMLQRMSARVAALQPADGMWRTSLLSPTLYPAPETSGTALFVYAMAAGIRSGVLDRATYQPVLEKAWAGLTSVALQPSGFLSNCQGVGEAPGNPSTTTSIGYCVGAFTLAATEIAKLDAAPPPTVATDSFTRTVATGWGTAAKGGAWSVAPSTAGTFSVEAGTGRVVTPAGTSRTAGLPSVSALSTEVVATAGVSRPTSGSVYVAVVGRRVGSVAPAEYAARAVVGPDGIVRLQLRRSDATLIQVTVPGLVVGGSDRLTFRLQVTGRAPTELRAKVWRSGSAEPVAWTVAATDATAALQGPGSVGVSTYVSSGGSPATPAITFDDFTATTTDPVVPPPPTELARDEFMRTVAAGWGAAPTGGAWTVSTASAFSVASGTGRISTASGQTRTALLGAVASTRTDLSASLSYVRPSRGSVYTTLVARRVGTAEYVARAIVAADGTVRLQLQRSGVTLADQTVSGLTFGTADSLRVRVQAVGTAPTTLRARVWRTGTTEPTTWGLTTTDASVGLQAAGSVGVANYLGTGSTPSTVTVSVDDVVALPPA